MNRVMFSGKVFGDVVLKSSASGSSYIKLKVSSYDGKDKDGKAQYTSFDVVAFGKTADHIAKLNVTGKNLLVDGKLSNNQWVDADGKKHYSSNIVAEKAEAYEPLFGSKKIPSNLHNPEKQPDTSDFYDAEAFSGF